ncbi:MAG: hypothetical protein AB9842_00770 [Bacteroidales bacterium]
MNRKNFMQVFILLAMLCYFPFAVFGQGDLKTTELNVFKNGTYFVVKEGNVSIIDGVAKMELPPSPLLGTFWLSCSKEISINKLVFISDTLKRSRYARSITDLIKANKGKKAKLTYRLDEKNIGDITGTIQDYFVLSGLVKVKTGDGKTAYFPANDVKQLFIDDIPSETITGDSTAYLARIEFNRSPRDTRLKLVYMQAGIQWFPTYNIKIINEKELQLELRALVENFAEVVKDASLTLTVGDPNYKYGRTIEQFATPYLTNIGGGQAYNPFSSYQWQNTLNAAAPMARGMVESADKGYVDYQTYETEGEKTGDLYMYNLGKVTIPKNSKASFQVFSQKIPYRDVYKVGLGDVVNYYNNRTIYNDPERKFEVYHSLKLTNTTKDPFTTAPAFVMDEELRPLAQDEVKYTPLGGTVSVNLSKSLDIIVKNNEEEKNREERAKTIDKHSYTKVIITGSIDVMNTLNKKITINADKFINGKITEVSHNGKIIVQPVNNPLNPYTRAEWEVELEKNEKKTITYTYEVYIMVY